MRREGYGLCVCVCVCLSSYSRTTGYEAAHERYQRLQQTCQPSRNFRVYPGKEMLYPLPRILVKNSWILGAARSAHPHAL